MDGQRTAPFSYADIKAYATPEVLDDLQVPEHGIVTLPHHLAWGGRREFDLDDDYGRAAMYKIVLEEGQQADQRCLLNRDVLHRECI